MPDDPTDPPRLVMERISKGFGGVRALEGVTFDARAGEVHALCGENGAGKSTLMKILAGAIADYEGTIRLEGREVRFRGPRDAEDAGIRIIHQELNLVPDLTVGANIFLGRERTNALGLLDDRGMAAAARAQFARLGAPIDPWALVRDLRIGDQQMVEIAKALTFDAAIVVMDEPTSALSGHEVARLFRVIQDLRRAGTTVLYISHKMDEVFALADRVTVLRDGRFVATADREGLSPGEVVRRMVGRELGALRFEPNPVAPAPILEVEGLALPSPPGGIGRPSLSGISFSLHRGEILGVAGLLGAGRTELLEALFGASTAPPSGSIRLEGRECIVSDPARAIAAGMALVTEDRKALGLFDRMTVAENITLATIDRMTHGPLIDAGAERRAVTESITGLGVKSAGGGASVTSLSGGNQQKCILARWLLTKPRVLLLDEPTRGIDVGAKAEIYAFMRRLARDGLGILMTSGELPELLTVCDRILVLCEGRLTADLPRAEANEERIMEAATRFLDRRADAAPAA